MTQPLVPQMPLDDFEDLARGAPETVWLEFVRGKVEVKPPSDGNHSEILVSLLRQFASKDRTWNLYLYAGLCTEAFSQGRYLPDAMFVRRDHRLGHRHWASPDIVSAVVEIVFHTSGKDHRDHDARRTGYASAGIPVCLLIDRDDNALTVFSEPKEGHYQQVLSHPWGMTVKLPSPVNVALNTERLKNYVERSTTP
ncbi:Uma2 family endonuclease [Streptomyces phaeochromogenes]|uniref:Uma2 family endonuclease n=1 Tax=Streptomyces phaeochromogenes TaxID=1923 RepID=UPI0033E6126D